jgi:predicted nucleic acid-binding protein
MSLKGFLIMSEEKPKVYLDTTIFSYLVDTRADLQREIERTIEWWENEKQFYEVFSSDFALNELKREKFPNQDRAIKLAEDMADLLIGLEIDAIAKYYIDEFVMPADTQGDAAHLAIASYYNMDYLLTWNCKHLANIKKKRHIETINKRLNLAVPEIITPDVLRLEES